MENTNPQGSESLTVNQAASAFFGMMGDDNGAEQGQPEEVAAESEEVAEEVGQIVADAMKKAGEFYNLNIPLAGEYKIGVDWSVH